MELQFYRFARAASFLDVLCWTRRKFLALGVLHEHRWPCVDVVFVAQRIWVWIDVDLLGDPLLPSFSWCSFWKIHLPISGMSSPKIWFIPDQFQQALLILFGSTRRKGSGRNTRTRGKGWTRSSKIIGWSFIRRFCSSGSHRCLFLSRTQLQEC